mgnify:CR=1 FL=1
MCGYCVGATAVRIAATGLKCLCIGSSGQHRILERCSRLAGAGPCFFAGGTEAEYCQ